MPIIFIIIFIFIIVVIIVVIIDVIKEFQNIIIQILEVRNYSAKTLNRWTNIKKCIETKRIICLLNEIFLLMDSSEG